MGLARSVRYLGMIAMAALVIAGCGGGDETSAPAAAADSSEPDRDAADGAAAAASPPGGLYDSEQVAAAAIDLLGSDVEASTAVLMAMSKSHSLEGIVEAIIDRRLDANGNILVGTVVPFRSGFASTAPREELCLNPEDEFDCNQEIDDRLEDWESRRDSTQLTGMILRAAARGYDEGQITAAITASMLGTDGDIYITTDGWITDCSEQELEGCSYLGPSQRIVCLFTEVDIRECVVGETSTTSVPVTPNEQADDPTPDPDGDIKEGTYTGAADLSSDFGLFFTDLGGVTEVDRMTVVVEGGTVTTFELELTGTGATNLNIATGERLCENPLSLTASLSDPAAVSVDGNIAEVPATFRFTQGVGSGSQCFEESNVEIDQTLDDVATIVFTDTTATASLTAGFGGVATLDDES